MSPQDPSYKMLLIGETGAGKTAFVNLLCNCATIEAYDAEGLARFRRFNDMELERAESCIMESKTSGTKVYDVQLSELNVQLIDTPGFGDSDGVKKDEENVQKIIAALEEEDYINCVCLIINGRQARMSATLKYVMSEIMAILPKQIMNNIIVVFSNTADPLDLNFDPNVLNKSFGLDIKHTFFIENPYCRLEKAKQKENMFSNDTIAKSLKKAFDNTADVLNDMCTAMKDLNAVHTISFITLYKKKQEIEQNVLTLVTAYDSQQSLEEDLKDAQEELAAAVRTKQLNKGFHTKGKPYFVPQPTTRHNTLCGMKGCHSNCHIECGLPKSYRKEDFKRCTVMGGNYNCSVCGHEYAYHYHEELMFVQKENNCIDEDMRGLFNAARSQEDKARVMEDGLMQKLEKTKAEKKRLSAELLLVLEKFSELSMIRNYAKLVENQIQVIDARIRGSVGSENADLQKTKQKLEEKFNVVTKTLETQ